MANSFDQLRDLIMHDDAFQAACQSYAHGNGSSSAIAAAALRAASTLSQPARQEKTMADTATDPWIGKYVVVRTRDAGVHAGILKARNGREAELTESRRLWRWRVNGNKGITLSDVATHGLDKRDTRVGAPVTILLTEDCEIIECSPEAAENIAQFATYEPR